MIRKPWRAPKKGWLLELCEDDGRGVVRAIPRFGYEGRDDFGELWIADVLDVSGEHWIPAGFYTCNRRGFRMMPRPGRHAQGYLAVLQRVDRKVWNEMHAWLRPLLERVEAHRRSGEPLAWEDLVNA